MLRQDPGPPGRSSDHAARNASIGDHGLAASPRSRTEAVIDLAAIAHNTRVLSRTAGGAALMAVIKANGFGHGAVEIARAALGNGASWLGVTSPAEAMALRNAGIGAPVLMWLYAPNEDLAALVAAGVDISVGSMAHLHCVADAARRCGQAAKVHLKVDTGMCRGGALPDHWPALIEAAAGLGKAGLIDLAGIWSHLGCAEDLTDPRLGAQLAQFGDAVAAAREAGLSARLLHLANSAALLQLPQARFDMVRAGIALYGVPPLSRGFGLRPAMALTAQVILAKRVPAGSWVSYGQAYRTDRETTLALVPLGFADGVPRAAGRKASVSINGTRCPVAGVISMDQFVVDAGDLPVEVGDPVLVFGPGDAGEPSAADWAEWAGTNPHEIFTGIGSRVPRRYLPASGAELPAAQQQERA
ncbi:MULTISPECIES: alanine racemase [Rhodomicrobium]|uniref:alanine racemase n=1 Tax=Rhodomicrobium TaxID=1068 RepID=UPI000B4B3A9C|nr:MULTISPECIES: alanine racemase [Rhodomicrobium]